MSEEHHNEDYYRKPFKKLIIYVSAVLIIGTAVTFAADLAGMFEGSFQNAIIFAMGVAAIKASAVIAIFMHLWWDAKLKTISWTLISTIFFFIGMMWLTVGSESINEKPGGADTTWKHGEAIAPDANTTMPDKNATQNQ